MRRIVYRHQSWYIIFDLRKVACSVERHFKIFPYFSFIYVSVHLFSLYSSVCVSSGELNRPFIETGILKGVTRF